MMHQRERNTGLHAEVPVTDAGWLLAPDSTSRVRLVSFPM